VGKAAVTPARRSGRVIHQLRKGNVMLSQGEEKGRGASGGIVASAQAALATVERDRRAGRLTDAEAAAKAAEILRATPVRKKST